MIENVDKLSITPSNSVTYKKIVTDITHSLNIKLINQIEVGTSNQVWNVSFNKSDCIFTLGSGINIKHLSQYFDNLSFANPHKYERVLEIQDITQKNSNDLLMPKILNAGTYTFKNYKFGYNLQEKSTGTLLHTIWPELDSKTKQEVTTTLLDKLGDIGSIKKSNHKFDATGWYKNKFTDIMNIARLIDVFDVELYEKIDLAFNLILKKAKPLNEYGLVHGDYFQKNIFVSKNKNQKYSVNSIIDWETATIDGHLGWDFTLSPWWISGEQDGDKELYKKVLGYQIQNDFTFFDGDVNSRLLLTELLWYITAITEFSILQRYERFERRLSKIVYITNCIISDEKYINE